MREGGSFCAMMITPNYNSSKEEFQFPKIFNDILLRFLPMKNQIKISKRDICNIAWSNLKELLFFEALKGARDHVF
jgi:hypothetical protein